MGAPEGLLSGRLLAHAVAGAAGSVVAMGTFYPLDTVRSRLQLDGGRARPGHTLAELRALAAQGGTRALYRGMGPVLQSLCASNFVYFYAFHALKSARRRRGVQESAVADLLMAAAAGAVNVLATNPLWVVNTRLKAEGTPYAGLWQGVVAVARAEGVTRLWSGVAPSLLLVCNPAIQFMAYETLKRRLLKGGKQASGVTYFALGAAAKALATLLTYPLQLLQAQMRMGQGQGRGLLALAAHVLRQHGLTGLFRGLEAKLLQTVLTAALMFAAYEKIAALILALLLGHGRARSHN